VLYGKFLRRMGEREKSYAVFQHAHQLNPKIAVVKQQLGGYLAEEGHYTEALGFFVQAVSLAPKEPLYHYQLAELLNIYYDHYLADNIYTQETLNKAIVDEFKQAAVLAPQEPGFAWRAAECYYDLLDPDWKAALAAWEELGRHTTTGVELEVIRLHRARVLLELGRKDDASVLLEQPVRPALEASRKSLIDRVNGVAAPIALPAIAQPPTAPTSTQVPPVANPPAAAPTGTQP
jgi:tetratricopeptide (TPR) repeat protein